MNRICIIILLVFVIPVVSLIATGNYHSSIFLSIKVGNDIFTPGHYALISELNFDFKVINKVYFKLGLCVDNYEIDRGEIYVRLELNNYFYISIGEFKNRLAFDQYLQPQNSVFATDNLISEYTRKQGYTGKGIGIKFYKNYNRNTFPVSYFLHTLWLSSHSEGQIDLGFFYHYKGKDSYLGFLASYFPFIAHYNWIGDRSGTNLHNFTINLIFSNYRNRLIFGNEISFGSNLIDPVYLIDYLKNGNRLFFMGIDMHLGYTFEFANLNWQPAVRYSILFPEISKMESQIQEILLSNKLVYKDRIYFYTDTGIIINTKYVDDILYTNLELVWALKLSFLF